ncbi:hypothetical protein HII17_11390 [Thalassotalea sp. M1531]|uniref:Peptidase M61 catalytic domain-containing protein n=1 Tax=Thalassotalea algicola TaxID=2716224 RepID=A0A7Y0LDH4_9GAMM|nr:hypothetical protein [Thalassotalea algicola]NMP32174.1 hypothetical protein [Thalassotalea algicola]
MKKFIVLITFFLVFLPAHSANYLWQNKQDIAKHQHEKIQQWLKFGVKATEKTFHKLPFKPIKFRVKPSKRNNEPVPWGQVNRMDNSILLHTSLKFSINDLKNDWTLYHELSHLYLPFLSDDARWLSEGFATYSQQIIMLKAGLLSSTEFVERISAGLKRGRKNTSMNDDMLFIASQNMRKQRSFMRNYWSGAAFFIEVDLALQQKGLNLPIVINRYITCCLTDEMRGDELISVLDEVSQSTIFSSFFQEYYVREDFPSITQKNINKLANFYNSK